MTMAQDHTATLPIVAFNSILFPDAQLRIQRLEARYANILIACQNQNRPFAWCGLKRSIAASTSPQQENDDFYLIGVEADILECEAIDERFIDIQVRGGRRFSILQHESNNQGLQIGAVRFLDDSALPMLEEYKNLLPLLHAIIADAGAARIPPPYRFDDMNWVGFRYAQILPISLEAKQRLLELEDAALRLSIISEYLRGKKLL